MLTRATLAAVTLFDYIIMKRRPTIRDCLLPINSEKWHKRLYVTLNIAIFALQHLAQSCCTTITGQRAFNCWNIFFVLCANGIATDGIVVLSVLISLRVNSAVVVNASRSNKPLFSLDINATHWPMTRHYFTVDPRGKNNIYQTPRRLPTSWWWQLGPAKEWQSLYYDCDATIDLPLSSSTDIWRHFVLAANQKLVM